MPGTATPDNPAGEKVNTFTAASNGWTNLSGMHENLLSVALLEFVLTAVFVLVVLGVTDRTDPSGFAPLTIGLTLSLFHFLAIPVSNASLNPARSPRRCSHAAERNPRRPDRCRIPPRGGCRGGHSRAILKHAPGAANPDFPCSPRVRWPAFAGIAF